MENRVALITGAGSGIGRGLALALAEQGWSIAALDCQPDGLASLEAELQGKQGRLASVVADVTEAETLRLRVQELESRLGPVDMLVASAGIGIETSALELQPADMARIINVNLLGVANSIAAVLPGMLERRRGHLVALSSVASFRGLPRLLGYCASKSGVNALMDGLRVEVRPYGIHATTICPSWIRTPMTARIQDRLPDILELDAAIRHILWAIEKKKAFYAFPRSTVWRLNLLNWLPRSWQDGYLSRLTRQLGDKQTDTVSP